MNRSTIRLVVFLVLMIISQSICANAQEEGSSPEASVKALSSPLTTTIVASDNNEDARLSEEDRSLSDALFQVEKEYLSECLKQVNFKDAIKELETLNNVWDWYRTDETSEARKDDAAVVLPQMTIVEGCIRDAHVDATDTKMVSAFLFYNEHHSSDRAVHCLTLVNLSMAKKRTVHRGCSFPPSEHFLSREATDNARRAECDRMVDVCIEKENVPSFSRAVLTFAFSTKIYLTLTLDKNSVLSTFSLSYTTRV